MYFRLKTSAGRACRKSSRGRLDGEAVRQQVIATLKAPDCDHGAGFGDG